MPSGTGTIVEVRDAAGLAELVPQWEALAADAAEPNPFYEHWMLLPALEAYGAGEEFRCVVIWDDGTLGALIPMRAERRYRGLPVRALRSWRDRNSVIGTPLMRQKSAAKCVAALLASDIAPALEFEYVCAGGLFYGALADAAHEAGVPWIVTDAYSRALLVRERDPRERFTSNMKNNLRRSEARVRNFGKLEPVRFQAGDDLAAWTEEFMRLEASGWKGRAGSALACREDDRRYAHAIFPEALRRGRLHITGLDLDGRALARHVLFTAGEGCFTFKIAYDEAYEKCSPGVLAEVDNVRQFMATPGWRWIDSNTSRANHTTGRVWKDRHTFQHVAVGLRGAGRFAVALLPLLRLAKQWTKTLRRSGQSRDPIVTVGLRYAGGRPAPGPR